MADFVTLTCPTCGGKLEITENIDRFACGHCGNEHLVKRAGGIIALEPVISEIRELKRGIDRTGSELAIKRLKEEIFEIEDQISSLKSDVSQTEAQAPDTNSEYVALFIGPILGFGIIGLLILLLVIGVPTDLAICSCGLILIPIGLILWAIASIIGKKNRINRLVAEAKPLISQIKEYENVLEKKQAELERNKKIVSK